MASIRKRGNSYLLVVSMGYTPDGRRRNPQQKTVKPPTGLTPKQTEKWLQEQAMIFEMSCKKMNPDIDRSITLEKYTEIWLQTIAPDKLAKSTLVREKQDIERFNPYLGSYKLVDLRPEHFRSLYAKLRKQTNKATGKPLSEATVEGVHSCLCGILSDAMEGGYLDHNPAWRTYKYAGQKKEKKIADDETVKQLIQALETVSILYETYFKLIIATGMRRGECCALKWEDINYAERSIHVCRNAVKTTGDEIIVREQTKDDYVFRRKGMKLPMTPSTFTWRFKKIFKANDLPTDLNVHSLRHTAASLFIASGTDVGTVAGLLGHSQPSTTLDIYTHAFDKNKKSGQPDYAKQLGDLSYFPKSSVRLRYASKVEIQTNSYKNSVRSDDFTEFLVRPARFERPTYRVGVFRHQRIKCCVFKERSAFGENVRLF